jgi:MFS superfamily sulfate permease-like transporter
VVGLMPIATLVGIVVAVAVHTFQWRGLLEMHRLPWADNLTMLVSGCVGGLMHTDSHPSI